MESQRIAGRYLVLRAIGRGGMGVVWLCRDEVLGREVAVKQIGGLPGEPEVETARAMREARSAAALNHPNVVSVYDVVDHDGRPWLVMEYVDGPTLAEILSDEGRLPPLRVADIGARIASALARAHERGIVHRDVKPGNVLLDRGGRPKISDFGIARGHGDDQLTQTGFFTGTPGYLSPELARGGDPDPKTDVWALGATLYAAVEGQAPYEPRSNPLALLRDIASEPPRPMQHAGGLAPAIAAMMDQDPARRWDMATAAERLGAISRGESLLEDTAALDPRDHDATRPMAVAVPPGDPGDPGDHPADAHAGRRRAGQPTGTGRGRADPTGVGPARVHGARAPRRTSLAAGRAGPAAPRGARRGVPAHPGPRWRRRRGWQRRDRQHAAVGHVRADTQQLADAEQQPDDDQHPHHHGPVDHDDAHHDRADDHPAHQRDDLGARRGARRRQGARALRAVVLRRRHQRPGPHLGPAHAGHAGGGRGPLGLRRVLELDRQGRGQADPRRRPGQGRGRHAHLRPR